MDYFRTDCIKSYFEIVAFVNKGNKTINEQTEAKFFIKEDILFLGINEQQKFQLCLYSRIWLPTRGTGHDELKNFICEIMRKLNPNLSELNSIIKAELFKLSD